MLSILERVVSSGQRLLVLPPVHAELPQFFRNVPRSTALRNRLLGEVQRLRGSVYLEEGAISPAQLTEDGRHETPEDDRAWHLVIVSRQHVTACVWYLAHDGAGSLEQLRVRDCPLAFDPAWRSSLRQAVETELRKAHRERLCYAELGGWAVTPASRHTGEGLILALAAYSLGRAFGGALGLTTATVRHASSTILRRLGGDSLEVEGGVIPPYFDPRYQCEMEILRFDSREPNPRYSPVIDTLVNQLAHVPVVACSTESVPSICAAVPVVGQWQPLGATGGAAA